MSRILRLSRYASWNAADQVITLGVPRLILFPILGAMLGEDSFGTFVIALGLINMVGLSPSNGLVGYIIRDLVKQDESSQPLLLRTSLTLSLITTLPFTLFFIFGASTLARLYQNNASLLQLLPWLGGYLLLTNIVETSLTMQRVRRNFHISTLVHALQSAILFSAIPLYRIYGEQGIAIAFVLATAASLMVSLSSERSTFLRTPIYSNGFAKAAMRVWPAFSISAFISLSAGYLDRLMLGYWWAPAVVAPFFAAVSTASMFAVPGVQASNLMLSMLGKFQRKEQFDRRFYRRYACFIGAWTIMAFVVGVFLGKPILTLLYPRYVDQALPLWSYAVAAFAISNVPMLCRPFVSKFLNPSLMPVLSTISLIARIVPLILLVPTGGKKGAVLALLIGSSITALAWLLLYLRHFVYSPDLTDKSDEQSHSPEKNIDLAVILLGSEGYGIRQVILNQLSHAKANHLTMRYACLKQGALAEELQKRGEDVTIIGGYFPTTYPHGPAIAFMRWLLPGGGLWTSLVALNNYLNTSKPDVVYSHFLYTHMICGLVSPLHRCKFVGQVHGMLNVKRAMGLGRIVYSTILYLCLDRFICVSNTALQTVWKPAQSKGSVILVGLNVEKIQASITQSTVQPGKLVIVGRITPPKKQDVAIQAVKQLVDQGYNLHLDIIGGPAEASNPYFTRLQLLIDSLDLSDRVTLVGKLEQPYANIAAAELLVNCSTWEGFGAVVAEGMICEKPVIVPDEGAPAELVDHNITGLHFKADDVASLACAIEKLHNDEKLRIQVAKNAKQYAHENFDMQTLMKKFRSLLDDCLFRNSGN